MLILEKLRSFNGFRTENYSYDVLNRLIGIKDKKDEKVLEYDSRGNLIKVRKGDEILESYIYDRTNRLIRAENSNKTVASFMYDGNGRRVRKEHLYGVSEYVPDYTDEYNRVLFVSRKNGNESLVYGNGLIKSQNCGEVFCYFENEMTSVMRIADNDGNTKRIMQYSLFGEVYEFGKTKDMERTPVSFTGYECEENLNLMYAQARYYLPKVGRFAEEDSNKGNGYLPESLNYYMYCYNNPLDYIDLNGKSPIVLRSYFERVGGDINAKANNDTSIAVVNYKGKTAVFYATNKGMDSSSARKTAENLVRSLRLHGFSVLFGQYYEGEILSDGSMAVDSSNIAEAFGLNESDVIHKPGDIFNSTDTAMQMFKTYYKNSSDFNNQILMGSALYGIKKKEDNSPSKFSFCKAIDYKSLLNIYTVGNNLNQPIIHYMLVGCTDKYSDDIQNRYIYYDNRYLHFIEGDSDVIIEKELVTSKQLKAFGWKNCSESEVSELNCVLKKYGITTPANIVMFMATAGHESGLGNILLEKGTDAYFVNNGYTRNDRGAGYIQITHRYKHLEFLEFMGDNFKGENTAEYIAENYPWEAAGWFWRNGCNVDLKKYIDNYFNEKNGLGVFLITQYFVNGYLSEKNANNDLISIRNGNSFKIENERLYINGRDYRLPNGWSNADTGRYVLYEKAIKIFK